jgi:hypothetical protein
MEPPKDHKLPSRDCCSPFAADMMVVQLQLYKGSRLIWPPYDMNTAKLVAFLDNPACLLSVTFVESMRTRGNKWRQPRRRGCTTRLFWCSGQIVIWNRSQESLLSWDIFTSFTVLGILCADSHQGGSVSLCFTPQQIKPEANISVMPSSPAAA